MNLLDYKNKVTKFAGNKQNLIIIFVVLLFLIAALFIFRRYVSDKISKKYVPNNEFTNDPAIQSADIYFFYTTWCPHCKTAKPIWNDFKTEMTGKKINGITLNFYEVDCDKDTATSDKFNVKGFPTIKMVKGNQIIEYDAKPSKKTLIEFVNKTLE
jgi:thiol-disulfide isomerase/thioredoxin